MIPDSLLISFHLLGEKLDAGNGLLLVVSIADDLVQVSQVAHRVPHKSDQKVNKTFMANINFQNLGNVIISSMCNLPPMCCQRFLHSGWVSNILGKKGNLSSKDTKMFKVKGCYILKIAGP